MKKRNKIRLWIEHDGKTAVVRSAASKKGRLYHHRRIRKTAGLRP